MSLTSQGINNPAAMSVSTDNLHENGDETDSFTIQQLFSFAWQIAKAMVITDQFGSEVFPKREGIYNYFVFNSHLWQSHLNSTHTVQ